MTWPDLGVSAANKRFVGLFGWIFREQPKEDYGIDAHVELRNKRAKPYRKQATGRMLALQIKAGPSWLEEKTKDGYVHRGRPKDLHYWLHHSLPVIVVLYDKKSDTCYWEHVTREKVTITGAKWKMIIPFTQKIEKSTKKAFEGLAQRSDYDSRLGELILAKPWMDIIRSGQELIIESTIVNDTSGQGTLDLWVRDSYGNDHSKHHWPYFSFPGESPAKIFTRLFPWADFHVDTEMYKAQIRTNEQIPPELDASIESWLEQQSDVIPIAENDDQIVYSLRLTLNPLGKAFLLLDEYLSTGQMTKRDTRR